ncbi:hypothetical protein EG329_007910 [Mollisiaceae sp. DMI_Dod_QoI]|nr:hypothetical protein EG329_007910 [Helotiales sp. DMI_Dod_QoI]
MPPTLEDDHFSATLYNGFSHNTPTNFNPSSSNVGWYDNSAIDAPTPQSGTRIKTTPQDVEKLRALPEVRPIPWRPGKECPPEKSTESTRPQTRGAFLLATRGKIRNPPCTHCETGSGRFSLCVSLNDWYFGACATCVMATRGNKCSLRQDVEEGFPPPNTTQEQEIMRLISPEDEDDGYEQTSSLKRKRSPTRAYVAGYSQDKKRVQELQAQSQMATNANTYQPYTAAQPANPYSTMTLQTTTYTGSANPPPPPQDLTLNDKSALLDYVYQKQYPPNGRKRHQILHQTERESSHVTNGPTIHKRVRIGTEYERGEASNSMSPLAQPAESYRSSGNGAVSYPQVEPTALIDRLPKKKQREIFGIIGTLQSGIRLVRQQTDSLQKQLNLLQTALGIDLEDDDEGT